VTTCCLEEILIKALARRQVVIHWLTLGTVDSSSELTPVQVSLFFYFIAYDQNRVVCCQCLKIIFVFRNHLWNTEGIMNLFADPESNLF
jgi:hypothetical protein